MDVSQALQTYEFIRISLLELNIKIIELWFKYMIFTWRWWLNVGATLIPWIVWIILRKKESTDRLLYAGVLGAGIAGLLDGIGVEYGIWDYRYKLEPLIPGFFPFDFSLFPVAVMLSLQYLPKLNPIVKAVAFSAFSSFIVEPFWVSLQIYHHKSWKHYYSFPVLVVIYLIIYYVAFRRSKFEPL